MSAIKIKNSESEESILFPVGETEISLEDLQSAFPSANSLRYKDENCEEYHHVICRNGIFKEPEGGWLQGERIYVAVCNSQGVRGGDRLNQFEVFRRSLNRQGTSNTPLHDSAKASSSRNSQSLSGSQTTMLYVGHGHLKDGRFTKILESNTSECGGLVVVGPFSKTEPIADDIKREAFKKFCQQYQLFKRQYKGHEEFVLVYPDGTMVNKLPDNSESFTILGYRNYLDPKRRFDRLRLYICNKDNYLANNVEIISESSSDEELPRLSRPQNSARHRIAVDDILDTTAFQDNTATQDATTTQGAELPIDLDQTLDDSLSLVIECQFIFEDSIQMRATYPNNTLAKELFDDVSSQIGTPFKLFLDTGIEIYPENRMMDLSDNKATLTVRIALQDVINERGNLAEPTRVLKIFRNNFLSGRQLEITEENQYIEGDISEIYVGRYTLWENILTELPAIENIRFPLSVTFYGEPSEDFGGPRREFFRLALGEITERIVETDGGNVRLRKDPHITATRGYYVAGLVIGLSALENGPCADFLGNLTKNIDQEEEGEMFMAGLARTGLLQMMEAKPSLYHLFYGSQNDELTVRRLKHLMEPEFSEPGSNTRIEEERTYSFFLRYLRDVAAGRLNGINLATILQFVTGSAKEPVLGFEMKPSIDFRETAGAFPVASTCINRLTLPVRHNLSDDSLRDRFSNAFLTDTFGVH